MMPHAPTYQRSTAKDLDEEDYAAWAARYKAACASSTNRAAKVAEVCEELETGLTLLGATAVEDKLQVCGWVVCMPGGLVSRWRTCTTHMEVGCAAGGGGVNTSCRCAECMRACVHACWRVWEHRMGRKGCGCWGKCGT